MADLEEEQRKMEEALRAATREMQENGSVTSDTNTRLKAVNKEYNLLAKGLKGVGKALGGTVKAAGDLTKATANVAGAMARGSTSFSTLSPVVDALGGALQSLTSIVPVFGGALSAAVGVATQAGQILLEKMDGISGSFTKIGQSGLAGADGMTGLNRQFLASGLSLDQFTKISTQSSQALAAMSGSAFAGAERFSQVLGPLVLGRFSNDLRVLGLGTEEIAETAATFITQQTRLGLSQGMTQRQLSQATVTYVKELDTLSKLTGISSKELQDQQLQIQMETKFRSMQAQLINEQGEAGRQAANNVMKFSQIMDKFDPTNQIGAQIREIFATGGQPMTEGAKGLMLLLDGALQPVMEGLKSGAINEIEGMAQLRTALKGNEQLLITAGRFTLEGSNIINQGTIPSLMNFMNGVEMSADTLEKTRDRQIKDTDAMTKHVTEAARAMQTLARTVDEQFVEFLPTAGKMVQSFSETVGLVITELNNLITDPKNTAKRLLNQVGKVVTGSDDEKGGNAQIDYNDQPDLINPYEIKYQAKGGSVMRNKPYVVGEQGPELFIPRSSGQILPNMSGPSMNTPTAMLSTTGMLGTATPTEAASTATASRDDSNKLMAEQNDKLDELITVVKQSKNIHSKMLSASYS